MELSGSGAGQTFASRRRRGAIIGGVWAAAVMLSAMASSANAQSMGRICREYCQDDIAACVDAGGAKRSCRSQTLRACRRDGIAVCLSSDEGRRRTGGGLAAPTNLTATALSSSQIRLSWPDMGPSEVSQAVERSTAPLSGFTVIASIAKNIVTFTDSGLPQSSTFYYRVRVFSRKGASLYSNVASATTPSADSDPPTVPSGVAATPMSCSEIDVHWGPSTDTGSGVKGYNVYRNGAFWKQVLAPATSAADTGLPESSSNSYEVAAVDNAGNSSPKTPPAAAATDPCVTTTTAPVAPSTTTTTLPSDTTAPSVPANLTPTVVDCGRIDLSWSASTDAGGSGLAGYNLYGWFNSAWALLEQVPASRTSTSTTALTEATIYYYSISALDNAGNDSGRSLWVSAQTPSCATTTSAPVTTSTTSTLPTTTSTSTSSSSSSSTSRPTTTTTSTSTSSTSTSSSSSSSTSRPTTSSTSTSSSTSSTTSRPTTSSTSTSSSSTSTSSSTSSSTSRPTTSSTSTSSSTSSSTSRPTTSSTSTSTRPTTSSTTTSTSSTSTTLASTGGEHVWSLNMGGTVLADAVTPYSVAIDGAGNSVVTGAFFGTVDFGKGNVTSVGRADMFIAKYRADGVALWVRTFGDVSDQFGTAVGTDAAGNVYVTGYYFGTVDFGGGPLTSNAWDAMVAKYTPNGAHLWSKRLGGSSYDMGQAIAVDGQGNVIVGGQFASTADFGGGPLTSAGGYDGFVVKYDTNGVHQWSRRMGGAALDTVTGMGVDANGNVTAVGYFAGTSNFGGADLTSAGNNDVFVVRFTAAGAHAWSNRYGDADDQRAYAAAVDAAGNVALTGYFYSTLSFGGTTLPSTGGGADIFLAKLSASGGHVWSKSFGTPDAYGEVGEGVAFDGAGNVVLTGEIIRNVDFGGGALIPPTVTYDPFVAKFSAAGVHQWSKRFSAEWDDHGNAIAVDGAGNIIVTGDFSESEDFGGGPLLSPGGSDGFLVKFTP